MVTIEGGDPVLEELRRKYQEGDLVLFAGAGVSAAAGLPSWGRLVELLVERARGRGAHVELLDEIGKLRERGQFINALTAAKEAMGDAEFGTVVEESLDDQRVND